MLQLYDLIGSLRIKRTALQVRTSQVSFVEVAAIVEMTTEAVANLAMLAQLID